MWDVRNEFPNLKTVRVEVQAQQVGSKFGKPFNGTAIYDLDHMERRHGCSNPNCSGDGFSIAEILSDMVHKKETHWEKDVVLCKGHEPSPGKGYFPSCGSYWK